LPKCHANDETDGLLAKRNKEKENKAPSEVFLSSEIDNELKQLIIPT
jgi:hypothetical protein